MVINDHPTGSKSGPREKQTHSSLSESKCHSGKKYVSGLEKGGWDGFCYGWKMATRCLKKFCPGGKNDGCERDLW